MKKIHWKFHVISIIFLITTITISCKTLFYGEIDPYYKELTIYAKYATVNGTPRLDPDITNSSKATQQSGQYTYDVCSPNRVCLTLRNLRLRDELGTYTVLKNTDNRTFDVITEELNEDKWGQDSENKLAITTTQSLDIVLVLDFSTSLGDDKSKVITYATNFIRFISANNPQARIGVVAFSQNISTFPLGQKGDFTNPINFIGRQTSEDATKLYEAIDYGISMLYNSSAESRALIVFTDGKNNAWSANTGTKYQTTDYIISRLRNSGTGSSSPISCYSLGLEGKSGGVDSQALSGIALNGGSSEIASSSATLENLFNKYAASVSTVYTLQYNRNNSVVTTPIQLRFRLKTKLQ
ncbi:hypothetical protein GCM10028805_55680 [Spirosoma harenae]